MASLNLATLLAAFVVGYLWGPQRDDIISARELRILDSDGQIRAQLSVEENTGIVSLSIGQTDYGPALRLFSLPNGDGGVQLRSKDDSLVASLNYQRDTGTSLTLNSGAASGGQVALSFSPEGDASLLL